MDLGIGSSLAVVSLPGCHTVARVDREGVAPCAEY